MMRPWAGCNGNSERFRSFHGLRGSRSMGRGTHLGHGRAVPPMRGTHPKGQKFGARPTLRYPMGQKRSVFPTAGPTQYGGITQNLSTYGTHRYCTHRYKPQGRLLTYRLIIGTYKSGPLCLLLPHGYRNIITCTGCDLTWDRVL